MTASAGRRLLVVGAGLIGTSVALAAQDAGWSVQIMDTDQQRQQVASQRLAAARSADRPLQGATPAPELVCVAVGPHATADVVTGVLGLYVDATVIDTCSVKVEPQLQIESGGEWVTRYVGTHPLAGNERTGPAAARADLFRGRSWVLCPRPTADRQRVDLVEGLIYDCRAQPVRLDAEAHDRLLAVTSHLPQLVASALSGLVADAFARRWPDPARSTARTAETDPSAPVLPASALAGPALLDMTRIAASPSEMWAEIAAANTGPVRAAVSDLISRLEHVRDGLHGAGPAGDVVRQLVDSGRDARRRMGFKHAGAPPESAVRGASASSGWVWVDTVVDDTPGTLARVFAAAARLRVNVEDVRVDHAPYASEGVVSVAVRDEAAARRLADALGPARVSDVIDG